MCHTGDRCKTEALIQTARKARGWGPRVREGSQKGRGLALEGRLALGLSWEIARDSDDFSPSSTQIIANPWPSPWVVLLSVHSTKAKWARPSRPGTPAGASSATSWEKPGHWLGPLSSPTHSECMPRPRQHLPHLTKGSGRRGLLLSLPSYTSHELTQGSRAASQGPQVKLKTTQKHVGGSRISRPETDWRKLGSPQTQQSYCLPGSLYLSLLDSSGKSNLTQAMGFPRSPGQLP